MPLILTVLLPGRWKNRTISLREDTKRQEEEETNFHFLSFPIA